MGRFVMVSFAGALLSSPAFAGVTITGKPKVVFHATGSPGVLTFDGTTRQLSVDDDGTTLRFTVPLDTVQTGISLRDQHMRDTYVQTAQFPDAVLSIGKADVTWPESGEAEGEIQGTFTAHGVEKTVPVTYSIKSSKGTWKVKASFPFNTSDHGIDIPKYLGVTIKPEMNTDVTVDLVDAS